MQQQQAQLTLAKEQATAQALQAQAMEAQARAGKYTAESQVEQYNAETQRIKAVSVNLDKGDADDKEFEKRMRLAELTLKKQKQDSEVNLKKPQEAPGGLEDLMQEQPTDSPE